MDTHKHTKGDWEFSNMSYSNDYTVVHIGCGDELLAIIDGTDKKRVLADACLMAAAPDLLMALHNLTIWLKASNKNYCAKELYSTSLEHYLAIAQKAINKATKE